MRHFSKLRGKIMKRAMNGETWRQRMRRRRNELGLTQPQLAEKLEVSQSTITHWETGRREPEDLKTFEALATALEMHPAELIYGIEMLPPEAVDVGRNWTRLNEGAKEAMATSIRSLAVH